MTVREIPSGAVNGRAFVDEFDDEPERTAVLTLDDDTGTCACHRCGAKQDISFHCIHIERVRKHIYG